MKKISFKSELFRIFLITSMVPIIVLGIISMLNIRSTMRNNTDRLMQTNMAQVDDNLNIWLESYEDVAYQIYTDDNVVEWVKRLDAGIDTAATVSQMRRFINGVLNTKDYVRAITIVTEGGNAVTYDQITKVTTESSWIDNFSKDFETLKEEVSEDYRMHIYPTEYATTFATKDHYLFHIAHRIVDYRKIHEDLGIVIVSIDESFLQNIFSSKDSGSEQFTIVTDANGRVLTAGKHRELIGQTVTPKEKIHELMPGKVIDVYTYDDTTLGWKITTGLDESNFRRNVFLQIIIIVLTAMAIIGISTFLTFVITRRLTDSVKAMALGMERAEEGDLSTKIEIGETMPLEMETMATSFNEMIAKLDESGRKEKEASRLQQEAQIAALEAQINPHFLYNTLDTINWMAIERDEYDISNAINALANILRYAIKDSNARVTVREEVDWLKKYVFLQQFRLKNKFICNLHVDPEIMDARIYKLLMQPFIENAIIHGFEGDIADARLDISISRDEENDKLLVEIEDNGKGISEDIIEQINSGNVIQKGRTHIGMGNVITRIRMYYGDEGNVTASSKSGKGTIIRISVPFELKTL